MKVQKEEATKEVVHIIERTRQNIIIGYGASSPCAEEIVPFVDKLLQKIEKYAFCWIDKDMNPTERVERLTDMVEDFGLNTRNYKILSEEEISGLEDIYNEMCILFEEVFQDTKEFKEGKKLWNKVDSINQLMFSNVGGFSDRISTNDKNWQRNMVF